MVRSTLLNISELGLPSGLQDALNELVCGKVAIFRNGEENCLEWNASRNIHFDSIDEVEFCAIFSLIEHQDDPEQVV